MEGVGRFLERFRKILRGGEVERTVVAGAVLSVLGVHIEARDVSIRQGVAHVRLHSAARSELHLRKEAVLQAIRDGGVTTTIRDVR